MQYVHSDHRQECAAECLRPTHARVASSRPGTARWCVICQCPLWGTHTAFVFLRGQPPGNRNNGGDSFGVEFLTTGLYRLPACINAAARWAATMSSDMHIDGDGPTVFAHACKMGLEGIVSKRKGSTYRSGRSPDLLKSKNSACEAVRREEE